MQYYDRIKDVDVPVLNDGQLYIYVLENSPQGNIKIGMSTNMQQRLHSLSGSNSGGNKITRCAISDATYLYTLERILHNIFREHRIDGTEWFHGDNISFATVCQKANELFASIEYQKCNEVRKTFVARYGANPLKET